MRLAVPFMPLLAIAIVINHINDEAERLTKVIKLSSDTTHAINS